MPPAHSKRYPALMYGASFGQGYAAAVPGFIPTTLEQQERMSRHQPAALDLFAGDSELSFLMRAKDWAQTPLGAPETWPQSLKTCVRIILTSRQAMFVWWGDQLINLYNDAYKAIVGGKHPEALGQPAEQVWAEIWDQIGPRAETAIQRNEGTYDEALLLIMERYGYAEETYYTFSYSPVPNDFGGAGGIICANTDDTPRIIGQRQLTLLRELGAGTVGARTAEEACAQAALALNSNRHDLPFALVYLMDPERRCLRLAGSSGMQPDHPAAQDTVDLDVPHFLPFAEVVRGHVAKVLQDLSVLPGTLPAGAWDRPPTQAVVLPLAPQGETGRAGVLVVGLNPYRLYDSDYESFLGLVAGQIGAGIANAHAYEQERKRAEALAELDRAKTTFFSNVSHEFRTPLTLMLAPLEDVLNGFDGAPLSADQRERLDVAHRNSLRLLRLVNMLLDFSRIEAGRVRARYQPTDIAALTADLASGFRSAVDRAGLYLNVECETLPAPVFVDRDMWEKIVLNLLSNAFKFTFEGGIAITLRDAGDAAEIVVRDTGVGIPESELPRLFERFHRIEGQRSRSFEGSGIGLALVHELISLHGGTITASSEPGAGTAFTLKIPFGAGHLPEHHVDASAEAGAASGHTDAFVDEALHWLPSQPAPAEPGFSTPDTRPVVLLADDNADMRDYVRRLLEERFSVIVAADGDEALAIARGERPDLVLSDVMMPVLDGFGLLRAIRNDEALRDVPVILLSARAGEEARSEGLDAGADDYLTKPFSARELLARVNTNLAMARVRRELMQSAIDSAQRLRLLFEQAPGFMCTLRGPDFVFELANAAYLRVIGRDDVIGKPLREVLPEIEGQGFIELLDEVYATGRTITGRSALLLVQPSPDEPASERYLDFVYQPVRDHAGQITGIFVEGADVTEARIAENALRASESQFRTFAQTVPNHAWTARPDGIVDWVNDRIVEYCGASAAEMQSDLWERVVHPEDFPQAIARWEACVGGGATYEVELRIRRHDGAYRWHIVRALPIYDAGGAISRWIGTNTDIDDQKMATQILANVNVSLEESVRERTRERDGVWRTSQDLFVIFGSDAVFRSANPAWTELLGYDGLDLEGARFDDFVHPEDMDAARRNQARLARGQALRDVDIRMRAKDGTYRWFSWHCIPENGEFYAAGRDITERKHLEEQLRQSQKMEAVGQLTGGLAHDFNNLLAGISGSLELLQVRVSQGRTNDLDRYLSAAQGAAKRAAALTHRLLAFSRRQTLDPKAINVNRLVAGMEDLIRRTAGPQVTLEVAAMSGLWTVQVDPNQLESALLNLCINARDAMPDGGRLTIETCNRWLDERSARDQQLPPGQYISLCVSDTGTGMTQEVIARAFDPFFTTKPIGMGTGLGLSMIYGFARQSGGHVRIYSELGHGSMVCVYLPRHRGPAEEPDSFTHDAETPRAGQGETVLVVDDEPTVRMLVTEILEDLGYTAIEAADGAEGLKVLQSDARIDLLVTDVGLPGGMNGRQLADAGRALRQRLQVLFITGYAENAVIGDGHLEPGMHVLTKPFAIETLASRIRDLIGTQAK
jgi:PAS domain S-box-containing protein